MSWLRKQLNEIIIVFCVMFGVSPPDSIKKSLGLKKDDSETKGNE